MVYILSSGLGDITVGEDNDEEEADFESADLGMLLGIDDEDEEPVMLPDDDDKEGGHNAD